MFGVVGASGAQAASDATCKDYARNAVEVATRTKSIPCPLDGPAGRWSTRYDDHYNWCRTVRDRTLDEENVARDTLANVCAADHATCQGYANTAIAQVARLEPLKCLPRRDVPGRWSSVPAEHYNWCRVAISKSSRIRDETAEREKVVNSCARCDLYARGAVASAKKLFDAGCGGIAYGQGRWSTNLEDHRNWCLSVRESTQNTEDRAREDGLARCERMNSSKTGGGTPPPVGMPPPSGATAKPCTVVATLNVYQCTDPKGVVSEYFTRGDSPVACGMDEADAEAAAKRLYAGAGLGDGPGTCQYRAEFAQGLCTCTFPPGQTSSALSLPPDRWASFATNGRGRWGYAVRQPSFVQASELAVKGCGGAAEGCRTFGSSTARCNAYAESRRGGYWYAAGGADTEAQAKANALRFCQSGTAPAGSCVVAHSSCRP
ncbi:DUF4189 domain-containing protein [Piscinibacterium candidicorallinum]|uniref:DUF4189 domain-containing protein n=1 Tax=Piscinibacterium candidicorallinum TaxID=1793872 RepID=A0ABV7H817_9BURK